MTAKTLEEYQESEEKKEKEIVQVCKIRGYAFLASSKFKWIYKNAAQEYFSREDMSLLLQKLM